VVHRVRRKQDWPHYPEWHNHRVTPAGLKPHSPLDRRRPDGDLWFTEHDKIGKITPAGLITEFPTAPNLDPYGITAGSDGNLWARGYDSNTIVRITPDGKMTTFPIPTAGSGPMFITSGLDGNLWFSEFEGYKIGRITLTGTITEFPIASGGGPGDSPYGIVAGPDGNLWVLEASSVVRITPSGTMTTFAKPRDDFYTPGTGYMTIGPDGNIWYAGGLPGSPPRLARFSPYPFGKFNRDLTYP
jgi:streptogramin lyase